jgi:hypothetical protein
MLDYRRLSDEQAKASRQADAVDKEFADEMRSLVKVSAFQAYRAKLLALVSQIGESRLEPAAGIEGVLVQEFEKGTMRGLLLAANLPDVMLQQWKKSAGTREDEETE